MFDFVIIITFSPWEKVLLITEKYNSIRKLLSVANSDYGSHLEATVQPEVKREHIMNVTKLETQASTMYHKHTIY